VTTRPSAPVPLAALGLLSIAALLACSESGPPAPAAPAEQALRLFDLAGQDEPAEERLTACFGPLTDDAERAALLDALDALAPASEPAVLAEERAADLALAVVDITASFPGGGTADYSVHLEGSDEEGWTVIWFRGPGVEWPRRSPPRGQGLTSSPPPE
jgi:hypothetical protein